jgi:hypothetical protein
MHEFDRLADNEATNPVPKPIDKQIANYTNYKKKKIRGNDVGDVTLEDLEQWSSNLHRSIFTSPDQTYVSSFVKDASNTESPYFATCMTTPQINGSSDELMLFADSTYKLVYEGYPVHIVGQVDVNRVFQTMKMAMIMIMLEL